MIKVLFLQSMYNCPDEIMERLSSTGKDKTIWKHIWKQLEDDGISLKTGTIQDATFIETDPGKHGKNKPPVPVDPVIQETTKDAKEGKTGKDEVASTSTKIRMTREEKRQAKIRNAEKKRMRREERKDGKTRRSMDGTWTRKNNTSHFGNKLHTVQGTDLPLIREFVVTTA